MSRPSTLPPTPPEACDPRVARSRAAVLKAATELLIEGGLAAMTVDAVVARSGVAKTTVYRHWASRDELLLDAFVELAPEVPVPDPDLPFVDALRQFTRELLAAMVGPEWQRAIPALLEARRHQHDLAALEQRLEEHQQDVLRALLRRGVEEGAIEGPLDQGEACLQLVGPLLMASLSHVVVPPGLADRMVDLFLASRSAPAAPTTPVAGGPSTGRSL